MAIKIKKGDQVIVISGDDKGKVGTVLKAMPAVHKVLVEGVNLVKRHTKPTQQSAGGIFDKEKPVDVSNVALIDPKTGKPTRIGVKITSEGVKQRVAKRSGDVI